MQRLLRDYLLPALIVFMVSEGFASKPVNVQQTVVKKLEWYGVHETKLPDQQVFLNQYFDGALLDEHFLPYFEQLFELPSGNYSAQPRLEITRTEPVTDTRGIRAEIVGADFSVESKTVYRKKRAYAAISVKTIRKKADGGFERLSEFRLAATPITGSAPRRSNRVTTRSSILGSGNWYRIAITGNGVYRLSYSFLKSLGMDVDNIDPRYLRVHGSGGGQLPYLNASTPFDDSPENAIYVAGESDGKFDAGDYALFYGTSQTRWKLNQATGLFQHQSNQYCDTTYYFINADQGVGKRITIRNASTSQPVIGVTRFNDYGFHESDLYNLLKSGREWYGERLDNINATRTFSFSFPNRDAGEPLVLRAEFLGRAVNSLNHRDNAFIVKVNGVTISTQNFYDVGTSPQDSYALPVPLNDSITSGGSTVDITVQFYSSDPGAQGWINFLEL
ncbi:MAG: type secretion system sortase PorU, partial [Bacteroidota bacterium]